MTRVEAESRAGTFVADDVASTSEGRALDEVDGAQFLRTLVALVEQPTLAL